jgi:hypothetical protein
VKGAKLTGPEPIDRQKEIIASALCLYRRVDIAAQSLGLGVRTMYRLMARHNLSLKAVLAWPSVPSSPSDVQESIIPAPVPLVNTEESLPAAATPQSDVRRLTAADFTGPNRGNVNRRRLYYQSARFHSF